MAHFFFFFNTAEILRFCSNNLILEWQSILIWPNVTYVSIPCGHFCLLKVNNEVTFFGQKGFQKWCCWRVKRFIRFDLPITTGAQIQVSSSRSLIRDPNEGRPKVPICKTPYKQRRITKLMIIIIRQYGLLLIFKPLCDSSELCPLLIIWTERSGLNEPRGKQVKKFQDFPLYPQEYKIIHCV